MFHDQFVSAIRTGKLLFTISGIQHHSRHVPLIYGPAIDLLHPELRPIVCRSQHNSTRFSFEDGPGYRTDSDWELVPGSLCTAIQEAAIYGLPMIITETGVADRQDVLRPRLLREHFQAIKRLLHSNIQLFGYMHWSITDNFEWTLGLTPRFGLIEISYPTQKRRPRPSLALYRQLINNFRNSSARGIPWAPNKNVH